MSWVHWLIWSTNFQVCEDVCYFLRFFKTTILLIFGIAEKTNLKSIKSPWCFNQTFLFLSPLWDMNLLFSFWLFFLLLYYFLTSQHLLFVLACVPFFVISDISNAEILTSFPSTEQQGKSSLSKPCIIPLDTNNTQEWPCSSSTLLFFRFISTAACVPSAEHCSCIPSCYANVSSGTSLHRHAPCIFWGNVSHL